MICQICHKTRFNEIDDDIFTELVCENCGASYGLEYLGMYEPGSDERIDEGYESEEWKKRYKNDGRLHTTNEHGK